MTVRLALTPGEPAGIGPDLAILHAQQANHANCELVVFADPELLATRAKVLGIPLTLNTIDANTPAAPSRTGELSIVPIPLAGAVTPGTLNPDNAHYTLMCLDQAIHACQTRFCDALVTGPLQKSVINDAGIHFTGHTEYLAAKTHTERVVMMLATEGLKVALATTHLPLKDVANAITQLLLIQTLTILYRDLNTTFGLEAPRILVCGLNPHAGENGHLGMEEINTIIPALNTLAAQGMPCIGPLPADTLFTSKHLQQADAVFAMYHDQGLPVLKYNGFGQAANITLGLPIIRTSVDHGTALDLAGTGNIDTGSLSTAMHYARQMAQAKHTAAHTRSS